VPALPSASVAARLADAIVELADDGRRTAMAAAARADAIRFGAERRVAETTALYERLRGG
jgi:hypothetical protein